MHRRDTDSLSDDERLAWLRLIRSEGVGPRTFRGLVERYGGAAGALAALPRLHREAGRALHVCTKSEAEAELEAAAKLGINFVAVTEGAYPAPLAATADAPPLIALRGNPSVLDRPMTAIVGSRNASALGLRFAERLAADLGEAGFTIVSGLARGIDARAHGASLSSGTVAVLAGDMHASIQTRTVRSWRRSSMAALPSARCLSPGSHAVEIFLGATASFQASHMGSSSSKRPGPPDH